MQDTLTDLAAARAKHACNLAEGPAPTLPQSPPQSSSPKLFSMISNQAEHWAIGTIMFWIGAMRLPPSHKHKWSSIEVDASEMPAFKLMVDGWKVWPRISCCFTVWL